MSVIHCDTTELHQLAKSFRVRDRIFLTGVLYTARDAAHKRLVQAMENGEDPPFPLKGSSIYYAGPTPAKEGMVIGSCGPTTSGRMDVYTPFLLDEGLCCTVGKGPRNETVVDAIIRNESVYLCAIGGAGALACQCIESCEVIAYEDLGCESIKKLIIRDFPLIVGVDCTGGNIFA
ncbi:MAG: FumA C-terminus/TtdB family hydratase beta subunit [Oscillospiraceae bacterium]